MFPSPLLGSLSHILTLTQQAGSNIRNVCVQTGVMSSNYILSTCLANLNFSLSILHASTADTPGWVMTPVITRRRKVCIILLIIITPVPVAHDSPLNIGSLSCDNINGRENFLQCIILMNHSNFTYYPLFELGISRVVSNY